MKLSLVYGFSYETPLKEVVPPQSAVIQKSGFFFSKSHSNFLGTSKDAQATTNLCKNTFYISNIPSKLLIPQHTDQNPMR